MNDDEIINVPDLVDEFDHYLIWQMDEIIIVTIGLMAGILFDSPIVGALIGYYVRGKYINLRDTKPNGYVFHLLRDKGLISDSDDHRSSYQSVSVKEYIS